MSGPAGAPPPSGHVLARRYDLDAVIGRGGHGLVWKARDRITGRDVAVKMLTDVASRDPHQVERLRREQLALSKLAGTSAVELFDLCTSESGKLCLVMELLDGVDLEAHLESVEQRGGRIALPTLLSVLEPVVTTLERAHEQGIIHRDLKPANVFLLSERAGGGVRVLDFGLARLRAEMPLTAAGTVVGSPSYIAPEAWKGRSEGLDQRVDVYAFGVLVFRALAGCLPFPGTTLQEKFKAATGAPRPSLHALRPDVSHEVDEWVAQVLAIDPDLRFRTLRGTFNALLAALGTPTIATALVTAEDLQSASLVPAPLGGVSDARAPDPEPPRAAEPVAAPRERYDSGSIEIPMSGALPALKAVLKRAAGVVARVTDVVTSTTRREPWVVPATERVVPDVPDVPAPLPPPSAPAPPPASQPPSSVAVAPVLAVGKSQRDPSMVREWLAGSSHAVRGASAEPSDVVAWLSTDEPQREPTLPMPIGAPEEESVAEPLPDAPATRGKKKGESRAKAKPKKKLAKHSSESKPVEPARAAAGKKGRAKKAKGDKPKRSKKKD